MIIKDLKVQNFMPFYGQHDIQFPTRDQRNVIIIYGDNMRGKTSILNAIRWGLFGKALGRHLRPIPNIKLINRDAIRNDRDFSLKVSITFDHGGKEYLLHRSLGKHELIDTPSTDEHLRTQITLLKDGQAVRGDKIEFELNQVIPEQISRFFLFDGELLQEYEELVLDSGGQAEKIKLEIEKALGMPSLANGRNDLQILLKTAQRRLSEGAKKDKHLKGQADQLSSFQDKHEVLSRDFENLISSEQLLLKQIEDLKDDLEQSEKSEEIKFDLLRIDSELKQLSKEMDALSEEKANLRSRFWLDLIQKRIKEKITEISELQDKTIRAVNEKAEITNQLSKLNLSIKQEKCDYCGSDLNDHMRQEFESELLSLTSRLNELDPGGKSLAEIQKAYEDLTRLRSESHIKRVLEIEDRQGEIEINNVRLTNERQDFLKRVEGVDLEQIDKKRKKHDRLNREYGSLKTTVSTKKRELDDLNKKISTLSKFIAGSPAASTDGLAKDVELLTQILEVFENGISVLRNQLRATVEDYASKAFLKLTTDTSYKGLVINKNYGLQIVDAHGDVVDLRSAGAEQIVALSLISGLNKAAAKSAPIVMDTPFGRLDPKHRKNVLGFLPDMASQLVLLVHEGELQKETDLPSVFSRISSQYEIEYVSSSQSKIVRG